MLRSAPRALAALSCFLLASPAFAQVSAGGTPASLDPELVGHLSADVPVFVMPVVNVDALAAEDAINDLDPGIPFRFGADLRVEIDLARDGRTDLLPSGERVWRLTVLSPGATSLSFAFDRWSLPPGGAFYVSSGDGTAVLGAFTDRNNSEAGQFATTLLPGDEAVLEYVGPPGAEVALARVTHAYREAKAGMLNHSGACMNNVACSMAAGWEDEIRSVAKYTMGGSLCTGALINNTAGDGTPYFLTANHCYDGSPGWWVFWFNYESSACTNPSWDPGYDSVSGASYRANNSASDFVLVELNSTPPADYEVFYSGWSRAGSPADSVVGIHHPGGDIKKFSVENSQIWTSGNYWGVGPWDSGATEGGSSGSPLFDQDHRIVGQLYGGGSACWGGSPNSGTDIYGRLDLSWSGGSSSSRLSDWLDPLGTGAAAIDGYDPGAPTAEHDAAVSIASPTSTLSCGTSAEVVVELTNQGSATLSQATLQHRVDGGAWTTTAWNGSLSQGGSATVSLGAVAASGGTHSLEVTVDAPADEIADNDSATQAFGFADSAPGPLSHSFDGSFPPSGWSLGNADGAVAWARSTAASGFGGGGSAAWFNNFDDDYRGQTDYLSLPYLDLSSVDSPELSFDVAYARYNDELYDRLKVWVSDDCGDSWTTVYDKAGTTLATAPDHGDSFVPTASEWRTESLSLAAWASADSVLVSIGNVTGYGNDIWIDNVSVASVGTAGDDDDASDDDDGPSDDDDAPLGVCGNAPGESVHESEPNGWASSGQFDAVASSGGDLTLTGRVACASQWSADVDWFVVDLPCTGDADVRLDWADGSDLDYWIYGPDRGLLVKNEDEDYGGPAARSFSGGDKLFVAVSCWWGGDRDYAMTIDWDETSEPALQTEGDEPASDDAPIPGEEAQADDEPEAPDEPGEAPTVEPATGPAKFVQAGCSHAPGPTPALALLVGLVAMRRRRTR